MSNIYLSDIMMTLFSQIGSNFYDLEVVLIDRDKLDFLYENIFYRISSDVINLSSFFEKTNIEVFKSSDAKERLNKFRKDKDDVTSRELCIISKYMSTILTKELESKREELRNEVIEVLRNTSQLWGREFISILNLILLFDYDGYKRKYRNLVYPLAELVINLLYFNLDRGEQNEVT